VAKSNRADQGTGRDILEREAARWQKDGVEAASYFFIHRLIYKQDATHSHYGYFTLLELKELSKSPVTTSIELTDTVKRDQPYLQINLNKLKIVVDLSQVMGIYVDDIIRVLSKHE
jgi:hypothetical protein